MAARAGVAALVILICQLCSAVDQKLFDMSAASSDFSQRLYQKLALDKPNVVYSPYSIHSALTMTYIGARAETANQMCRTLALTSFNNDTSPHQTYHDIIVQLNSAQSVKLLTANGLFTNPHTLVYPDFVQQVEDHYMATTQDFDLAAVGGPEKAINDYVANKTEHMIEDILPPGSINGNTIVALVNTIFFNGTWLAQFETYKTRQANFTQLNGAISQVDMMHDSRAVRIKIDNSLGVDVAELPFVGGRFGLYIALPQQQDGVTDLEKLLSSGDQVEQLFEGLTYTRVQLALPKLKVETEVELSSVLSQLGMDRAFDPFQADFGGISTAGLVYIGEVQHKAVIELKESGTVAAAATAVGIKTLAILNAPHQTFIADHPFVFFLQDNLTKQILFQGKFSG